MAKVACPPDSKVQSLALGELSPEETEDLAQHLENCPACLAKVQTQAPADTLIEALSQVKAKTLGDGPEQATITRLIERLSRLTATPDLRPVGGTISFSCPHCGKGLKCKPELAGRKVKCPKCGQAAPVPKNHESGVRGQETGVDEGRTLPPAERPASNDLPETRTLPPRDSAQQQTAAASASQASATRSEVASAEEEEAWDFLAPAEQPDEIGRLGPYRILKVLGAGGMGVVFRAEDPKLKRIVALKAMLPALAASASAKKRFMREAQTAASIKHDHIVTIFQVDEDRGAPYLAMEFLHGEPLDARLKRGQVPLAEALRIGEQIAEGLAAAHDEGLIHRDIKPANIWLETRSQGAGVRSQEDETSPDKRPADRSSVSRTSPARVKILDFGLARSTSDQAGLTQSGAIVGTPSYMAPEQAQGAKVDHRCDLFSLGCVLYVMTTGQLPFKGNDTLTVLMAIASSDPPPPHELNPEIPEFLSSLVLRLLSKKADDRPQNAREVASSLSALRAELEDETAKPDKPRATGKLVAKKTMPFPSRSGGRKRLVLAGIALAALAVAVAGVVFYLQTPDGTLRVEINDPQIEVAVQGTKIVLKQDGKDSITLQPGDKVLVVKRGEFVFETSQLLIKSGQTAVVKVDFLPGKFVAMHDGRVIGSKELSAGGDADRVAAQWALDYFGRTPPKHGVIKIKVGDKQSELKPGDELPKQPFTLVAVSPGHTRFEPGDVARFRSLSELGEFALFGGAADDLKFLNRGIITLQLIELQGNANLTPLSALHRLQYLSFYNAGIGDAQLADLKSLPRLLSLSLNGTNVTDAGLVHLADLKNLAHLDLPSGVIGPGLRHLANLPLATLSLAPAADRSFENLAPLKALRKLIVAHSPLTDSQLMQLASLRQLQTLDVQKTKVTAAGVRKLKAALPSLSIIVDAALEKELAGVSVAQARSPFDDLKRSDISEYELAQAGGGDADKASAELVAILGDSRMTHAAHGVQSVAFSPDEKWIASAAIDQVRLWDAATGRQLRSFPFAQSRFLPQFAIHPDGAQLAVPGADGLRVYDPATGKELAKLAPGVTVAAVAYDKTGTRLVIAEDKGAVSVWDTVKEVKLFSVNHGGTVWTVAFRPDGSQFASGGQDKLIKVWDAKTGKAITELKGQNGLILGLAFNPDGDQLASCSQEDPAIPLWDTRTWKTKSMLKGTQGFWNIGFSPDGSRLAATSWHGQVRAWDPRTSKEMAPLTRKAVGTTAFDPKISFDLYSFAFNANGKRLVTGQRHGHGVWIWDTETGEQQPLGSNGTGLAVSMDVRADGRRIAVLMQDRLCVWDVPEKRLVRQLTEIPAGDVGVTRWSPDGKYLAIGGNQSAGLWDGETGEKLLFRKGAGNCRDAAFSPDGKLVALAWDAEKTLQILETATRRVVKTHDINGAYSVAFSPDGKQLAVGAYEPLLKVVHPLTGDPLWSAKLKGPMSTTWFGPGGREIIGRIFVPGPFFRTDTIWDAATGKEMRTFKESLDLKALSPNGRDGFGQGSQGEGVYDVHSRKLVWPAISGPYGITNHLMPASFAPDGRHVAIAASNGTVHIYRFAAAPAGPPETKLPEKLAGPLDRLDPAKIPPEERAAWQPKELVAVIGSNRQRHWGNTTGVAISPDGKTVASTGIDGHLRIWDAGSMKERAAFQPQAGSHTHAVAFAADGKSLASAAYGKINLWSHDDKTELERSIAQPNELTSALRYSPDGKTLFSGGNRNVVQLWDLTSRKPQLVAELKGHAATVRGLAVSPDGKTLASASEDKTVRLWDLAGAASKERSVLKGHADQVYSVSFSKDGKTLASGGNDGKVFLWDIKAPEGKNRVLQRNGAVGAVAFSSDGKTLAVSEGGRVNLLDLTAKDIEQFDQFTGDSSYVGYLAYSGDSKTLATAGATGAVRVWDVSGNKAKERIPLPAPELHLESALFSADGKALFTGNVNWGGRVWDVAGAQPQEGSRCVGRSSFSLAPDGVTLASETELREVHLSDVSSLALVKRKLLKTGLQHPILKLRFSLDGTFLSASTGGDKGLWLWKRADNEYVDHVPFPDQRHIYGVAFVSKGQALATGGGDGSIRLWDLTVTPPKMQKEVVAHKGTLVSDLASTRDGRTLASCGGDAKVHLWDVAGGTLKLRATFTGEFTNVSALAFSPDDRRLLAASDMRLYLLDAVTGTKLQEWPFPGVIMKVLFAPDNRHIATVNGNGTIYIMRLPPTDSSKTAEK